MKRTRIADFSNSLKDFKSNEIPFAEKKIYFYRRRIGAMYNDLEGTSL